MYKYCSTDDHEQNKLIDSEVDIPVEMYDFIQIIEFGARKYAANNWLEPDGKNSDHKSMHNSMFHHLADSWSGSTTDKDSGLHPLLHLACRALMCYTRQQRQIKHSLDK